ncbi:TlpA family protein disulfide reductase [Fusibacter ferrireducens]|uniref:TlpA family protein disulfide reductase n=1 Tax=Fusibacter ferrireducens TaxID=2785058 RepID=A0ABR9ZUI7_9FIRM|nr:TlpA disulfide reductase family protein [Fusibacter ferrireducens]MBF4694136.1 TlpA family protein disulfide reductase [Fusibacter ferrireducens]
MYQKIRLIPIILVLLFTTACGSSKIEAPMAIDQQSPSDQSDVAAESTNPPESIESTSDESTESTSAESTGSSNAQEAYIFPDFPLKKLDGTSAQLYDFKDKIIVINFWATWCHFCDLEMPLIESLSEKEKYQVLAVNVGEDPDTIQKYLDEKGLTLDVYLDEDQSLASQFSVTGFPTSVFIGPNFEYLYAYPGMLDEKTLDSILTSIDEYLAQ